MKTITLLFTLCFNLAALSYWAQESTFILSTDLDTIEKIQLHSEFTIDHYSSAGFELYGPHGMKEWLNQEGIVFIDLDLAPLEDSLEDYPSFENITNQLIEIATSYPELTYLFSLGTSVEGREIWALKISDNAQEDEVEPEFKYIANMHGNEIVGRELSLLWIKYLLKNYGSNDEITQLINNTEIYVIPSMNPDGAEKKRRSNTNGIDLNRDFPDWTASEPNTSLGKEPETAAMMSFQAQRQFSLSANFHGGAVCVNYPWDSSYERHPFNNLLIDLSLEYSILNNQMYQSHEFENGITNGADWYVLKGGMQDWSYIWHNDLQVTIELSDQKWPSYSMIPIFFQSNKDSMNRLANLVHQGAGFSTPTRSETGSIQIFDDLGNDLGQYSFQKGEFYKVLPVGEYQFEIHFDGIQSSEFINVSVQSDQISTNGNFYSINP